MEIDAFFFRVVFAANGVLVFTAVFSMHVRETWNHKNLLRDMHHFAHGLDDRWLTGWQLANSNLNFNKNLQWNLVYYALLLFGAVIALSLRFSPMTDLARMLLFIGSSAVFDIGIVFSWNLQHQIRRERLSILNNTMRLARTEEQKRIHRHRVREATKLCSHPLVTGTVTGVLLVGYVVATLIVLKSPIAP